MDESSASGGGMGEVNVNGTEPCESSMHSQNVMIIFIFLYKIAG